MKMNATGVTIGLILIACMTFTQGAFGADIYKLDKSHTRVGFMVRHFLISKVRGEFKQYEATILFDVNNVSKSSMEGMIQVASIDTGNEKRDKHLRSPDFFNAADYPAITFKSKRIDKQGDQYVMIGDFTIHGVTKEIEMPFAVTALITHRNKTRFGFSAELDINRQDYNVAYSKLTDGGGLVVSHKVMIEIDGEAIKQ